WAKDTWNIGKSIPPDPAARQPALQSSGVERLHDLGIEVISSKWLLSELCRSYSSYTSARESYWAVQVPTIGPPSNVLSLKANCVESPFTVMTTLSPSTLYVPVFC